MFFATAVVVSTSPVQAASNSAAIVVDASTGKTLYAASADAPRYPASLTKMMTLYMVFEAMSAGKINTNTRVPFSRHAASMPPTKLGVPAGGSVTLETAILSLVTKSANDAAAAIGELLGGSEANFARMMTAKANRLGMNSTTFRNASGLPDGGQKTTARDMAVLGMSLREHFPKYYSYFSTRSFSYGRSRMGNHNKLLGRVKGVDGIKTGYTNASGFNLVSSVKIGERKIVAVVMGGRTGASRDAHMAELIRMYMPKASGRDGDNPLVAARKIEVNNPVIASMTPSKEEIKAEAKAERKAEQKLAVNVPVPVARPEAPVEVAYVEPKAAAAAAKIADVIGEGDAVDTIETASIGKSGWIIQVGSVASEAEAQALLSKTAGKASTILASADPFTEKFDKNGTLYHRARFAGFKSQAQATKTCAALKKHAIACFAAQR